MIHGGINFYTSTVTDILTYCDFENDWCKALWDSDGELITSEIEREYSCLGGGVQQESRDLHERVQQFDEPEREATGISRDDASKSQGSGELSREVSDAFQTIESFGSLSDPWGQVNNFLSESVPPDETRTGRDFDRSSGLYESEVDDVPDKSEWEEGLSAQTWGDLIETQAVIRSGRARNGGTCQDERRFWATKRKLPSCRAPDFISGRGGDPTRQFIIPRFGFSGKIHCSHHTRRAIRKEAKVQSKKQKIA
jgi:hypothetical protein